MKFDPNRLVQLRRPSWRAGALVTADDLRAEQAYALERQWQHNRMLHGYGIVVGLEVLIEGDETNPEVVVAPGYALDGWGREIVLREPARVPLPRERRDLTVYIRYAEREISLSVEGQGAPRRMPSPKSWRPPPFLSNPLPPSAGRPRRRAVIMRWRSPAFGVLTSPGSAIAPFTRRVPADFYESE